VKEEWPANSGQSGATERTSGQSGLIALQEADDVEYEFGWNPGRHIQRLCSGCGVLMDVCVQAGSGTSDVIGPSGDRGLWATKLPWGDNRNENQGLFPNYFPTI